MHNGEVYLVCAKRSKMVMGYTMDGLSLIINRYLSYAVSVNIARTASESLSYLVLAPSTVLALPNSYRSDGKFEKTKEDLKTSFVASIMFPLVKISPDMSVALAPLEPSAEIEMDSVDLNLDLPTGVFVGVAGNRTARLSRARRAAPLREEESSDEEEETVSSSSTSTAGDFDNV